MPELRKSFKKARPAEASPYSFWGRIFGRKRPPRKAKVARTLGARAEGRTDSVAPSSGSRRAPTAGPAGDATSRSATEPLPLGIPLDMPRNPKSFLAKKFNSEVVRRALLAAIDQAHGQPPGDLDLTGQAFWREGLDVKRSLVMAFDGSKLLPDAQVRAIQWMANLERLDPRKATYYEDLFVWRCKIGWVKDKEFVVPPAAIQAGLALRKLYQVVRQKTDSLAAMTEAERAGATSEIDAYRSLMRAIEGTDVLAAEPGELPRLAALFASIDPYRYELTRRHPRFASNVGSILTELAAWPRHPELAESGGSPPGSER